MKIVAVYREHETHPGLARMQQDGVAAAHAIDLEAGALKCPQQGPIGDDRQSAHFRGRLTLIVSITARFLSLSGRRSSGNFSPSSISQSR